jgi:hypothetical protein
MYRLEKSPSTDSGGMGTLRIEKRWFLEANRETSAKTVAISNGQKLLLAPGIADAGPHPLHIAKCFFFEVWRLIARRKQPTELRQPPTTPRTDDQCQEKFHRLAAKLHTQTGLLARERNSVGVAIGKRHLARRGAS